jgi:hypothetical protein
VFKTKYKTIINAASAAAGIERFLGNAIPNSGVSMTNVTLMGTALVTVAQRLISKASKNNLRDAPRSDGGIAPRSSICGGSDVRIDGLQGYGL